MARNDGKYPQRRTYIVRVQSDAKPDAPAGRVENPDTGRKRDFRSGRELIDTIASDLHPDKPSLPKPTEE